MSAVLIQSQGATYARVSALPHVDRLPGGMADRMRPDDFDPGQLEKGILVELEHTANPLVAREIAMDHLAEDPRYYDRLAQIEAHPMLGQPVDTLLSAVETWIRKFESVPSTYRARYPTAHNALDEAGAILDLDAYMAIERGEPYALALSNLIVFNGREMKTFADLWKGTIVPRFDLGKIPVGMKAGDLPEEQLDLLLKERMAPTGEASHTIEESLPILKKVRSLLLAEKTGTAPQPVLVSTKNKKTGWGLALAGMATVAVLGGIVYAVQRS